VVIDVDGLLTNQRRKGLFGLGQNPVSLFVEKIDKAQRDPDVRAMIVRINSPGGGVTASDIMYRRLVQFRQARGVPVIAIIEDVGASGGYYIACGADVILAHPTTVTGSIGVIVQTVSFAGTMRLLGITSQGVTSGKHKDMASPFKPLDKEDLAILQDMVNAFHARFVHIVASGRPKMKKEKVEALADGRVYTARQALAHGLIDGLAYMDDAIVRAKADAHLERAKVVMYHRPFGGKSSFYSAAAPPAPQGQGNLLNVSVGQLPGFDQPRFLYLWTGRR